MTIALSLVLWSNFYSKEVDHFQSERATDEAERVWRRRQRDVHPVFGRAAVVLKLSAKARAKPVLLEKLTRWLFLAINESPFVT